MAKTLLRESANGMVFKIDKIPNNMFEFFVLEKKAFEDGTKRYVIGVSPTADDSKGFVFDTIRGHKQDALKRLDEIVKKYKQ